MIETTQKMALAVTTSESQRRSGYMGPEQRDAWLHERLQNKMSALYTAHDR